MKILITGANYWILFRSVFNLQKLRSRMWNYMSKMSFCLVFLIIIIQLLSCSSVLSIPPEFPKDNNIYRVNENFKKKWQDEYNATLAEIEQNRRLWEKNNIVNYSFVCQQFAGGMNGWGEVVIKVRESKNILIERTEKDSPAKIDGYENFDTIDKIFDYLHQELNKGRLVKVKYNKESGYPEELSINYSSNIDAFYGVYVKKFEIIK